MLVKYSSNKYSWGDDGKPFYGAKARQKALLYGVAKLGIKQFRIAAAKSGINLYDIEQTIAEYRAKGDDTYRGTTRDGTQESEDNAGDINESVASKSKADGGEEDSAGEMNDTVAYISQKKRDDMSKSDFAWPEERKYPINSQEEVNAAAKLIGRAPADKQTSIKRRIIEIAKRKGFSIPDSWK